MQPSSEPEQRKCPVCKEPIYYERERYCERCTKAVSVGNAFRREHFSIPLRYQDALYVDSKVADRAYTDSIIFSGPPGTGKTFAAYQLLRQLVSADPRQKIAAYSWAYVLMMLRRGYGDKGVTAGQEMIDALCEADAILLDDLGAEKITATNADWIRETLFVVLDRRWGNVRQTILTTNLPPELLPEYLGERIVSRVLGMCAVIEMGKVDRRMT